MHPQGRCPALAPESDVGSSQIAVGLRCGLLQPAGPSPNPEIEDEAFPLQAAGERQLSTEFAAFQVKRRSLL